MVTALYFHASATISASLSCCLAFKTLCGTQASFNKSLKYSDFSTDIVQTRTGCPFS
jgi:hypothetical protein